MAGRRLIQGLTSPWSVGFSAFGLAYGGYHIWDSTQSGTKYDLHEDLSGKTYIVTGATSGIGQATAEELAKRNARVIMACRNREKCVQVRRDIVLNTRNKQVYCRQCDLEDFESIRTFVQKLSKGKFELDRIDGIVHNAAMMSSERKVNKDGIEKTIATNHLGSFLLTGLLMDKMLSQNHDVRIVFLNSNIIDRKCDLNMNDFNSEHMKKFDGYEVYKHSKLASALFSKELAERVKDTNISVMVADPGRTKSNLSAQMDGQTFFLSRWLLKIVSFGMGERRTEKAVRPVLYALCDPETKTENGVFIDRERHVQQWNEIVNDEEKRAKLWNVSVSWTKLGEHMQKMSIISLLINGGLSAFGAFVCYRLILTYIPIFIQRKMYGNDQCKVSNAPVPEPMGVICAAVYLIVMFLFIPVPFFEWVGSDVVFPYAKLLAILSGLISISTAILLGFADDMLDLRWRHKLLFPTLSSLPLLMVYYVSGNSTTVIVPTMLRTMFPQFSLPVTVNISFIYYIFMGMVIVFCTNAINILAGINGLESGQSLVISVSIIIFNIVQLVRVDSQYWHHLISLYFLVPFAACTATLFYFNKYPARVFVGDTFCYWAGMTVAVVSILGHFSKTLMLFLIPQTFNFVYSIPQLFHFIPCPRHRLPKYDPKTDTVSMSKAEFKLSDLKLHGKITMNVLSSVGLLYVRKIDKDGETWIEMNNLTIINLVLKFLGPMHENRLNYTILLIQIICSFIAFFIRFYLASLFYDVVD